MRCLYVIAATSVLAAAGNATAGSVNVYLDAQHQGKGNKGLEFRPVDDLGGYSGLVLSAMSSIDNANPFDSDASNLPGSIYVNKYGTGVRTADGKGSKGISGGGAHKDEQLDFTFDEAAMAFSIQLGLRHFRPSCGLNKGDDPVLFISLVGDDDVLVLDETEYLHAYTSTGKNKGYIDFGMLGLGDALVDSFSIRETHGHIEVNGASFTVVPLPAPLLMGLAGLLAVGCARRRAAKPS